MNYGMDRYRKGVASCIAAIILHAAIPITCSLALTKTICGMLR